MSAPLTSLILLQGYLGTPQHLPNGTEIILPVPVTTQGANPVSAIDVFYQITSKLQAHYTRRTTGATNDYVDLVFLFGSYSNTVWEVRDFLNLAHRQAFFDDFAAANEDDTTGSDTNMQMILGLLSDDELAQLHQQAQQPLQ